MGKSSMLPGMLCRLVVPGSIPLLHPACLQSMAIGALECWVLAWTGAVGRITANDHACMTA